MGIALEADGHWCGLPHLQRAIRGGPSGCGSPNPTDLSRPSERTSPQLDNVTKDRPAPFQGTSSRLQWFRTQKSQQLGLIMRVNELTAVAFSATLALAFRLPSMPTIGIMAAGIAAVMEPPSAPQLPVELSVLALAPRRPLTPTIITTRHRRSITAIRIATTMRRRPRLTTAMVTDTKS